MANKDHQIKELIELNDELENYFRNTIIPQLFVDADFILRKYTPPAMKHFSLSNNDIGKSIKDIKENIRYPTIIDNIQQVIDGNEILEKEIQTTDFRWYQMNIIPYVTKQKKTNGVIITFVEITMRIKDLKEQEKLISEHENLLDTISHDIKTPLTSLVLTINLLKKEAQKYPAKYQNLLKIVEDGTKKMQNIIIELTDSRKEGYKYQTEDELLNFEHILEDVRLTLATNIKNSGANIKSEINISELTFSRRKLRSVLYNLVNNAIKFTPESHKPKIFIKTELDGNFILISVKDNGIGIEPSKTDSIFKKYYRIENGIEGTGIGLYLVKEIVTQFGGKILVESELGKGTEFKIYLTIPEHN